MKIKKGDILKHYNQTYNGGMKVDLLVRVTKKFIHGRGLYMSTVLKEAGAWKKGDRHYITEDEAKNDKIEKLTEKRLIAEML